ncbi:unnamed protein product [Absidia cylindrospora]
MVNGAETVDSDMEIDSDISDPKDPLHNNFLNTRKTPLMYSAETFEKNDLDELDMFGVIFYEMCHASGMSRVWFEKIVAHVNTLLQKYGNTIGKLIFHH